MILTTISSSRKTGRTKDIDKDISKQLTEKSTQFIAFSNVMGESTDLSNTSQPLIFIILKFINGKFEKAFNTVEYM